MNLKWYLGTKTQEEKLERAELVKACHPALRVLKSILEKDMQDAAIAAEALTTYENAAWPYYQADRAGMLRTYKAIIELLPKDDQSK